MIDLVQNAKDLIKKGELLNDPELIAMGNNLLDKHLADQIETEEKPKKKRGRPKKVETESKPVKKKRGRPPKKKTVEKTEVVEETKDEHDFSMQIIKEKKNSKFVDENGEERTLCRTKAISVGQNTFVDDLSSDKDDFDKLAFKGTITKRRDPAKKRELECRQCHNKFYLLPNEESQIYCNKCVSKLM